MLAALARRPVDRVPVFLWYHPETAAHLASLLEIPSARVGEAMGNDVKQAWVNNNYAMEGIVHEHDGDSHDDAWGIRWTKLGSFNQISHHPLADADREHVLAYRFPYDQSTLLLGQMLPLLENRESWFIGCDVSPCVFEMYWRLRGMENTLIEMQVDPELSVEMFGRCASFAEHLAEEACTSFSPDWLWTGDDVASQSALMMSPAMWRGQIRPSLQRVVQVGKKHGLPVAYHCCGSLRPIIGDLVETGIDILNPVQATCPGMDALELKKEFGSHLTFMGGLDTVGLVPHSSPDEVYRYAANLIEGMTADGGGYILAASHTIPPETPDENIFALCRAAGITREEIEDRAATIRASLR